MRACPGSGKSSLALGVLYAEGSRRYLEALSTYTRRRMTQAAKAQVDEVLYVPAALALHQRPGVPGIRSTFGTGTELLNSLRLMFSRLASHRCPNGHYVPPTLSVAAGQRADLPGMRRAFYVRRRRRSWPSTARAPAAPATARAWSARWTVATLVPDESHDHRRRARCAPWNSLMWSLMTDVCREMGVRTDVPFRELTDEEKDIVYQRPGGEKAYLLPRPKTRNQAGELDFTYYNAVYTVENALAKVKDEKGMKRVEKFLTRGCLPGLPRSRACPRPPVRRGCGASALDEACQDDADSTLAAGWTACPASLPAEMRPMAESICDSFRETRAAAAGSGARLSDAGPRIVNAFHR